MTKFFRSYGRTTLMYVMAALLLIWLLEGVMMRGGGRGGGMSATDEVIGTAFGEPIRQGMLRRAKADLEIAQMFSGQEPALYPAMGAENRLDNEIATALMLEEAGRMGFRSSRDRIRQELSGIPEIGELMNELMTRYQTTEDAIIEAIARVSAAKGLQGLQVGGVESLPRLEQEYLKRSQQLEAKISAIEAEAFMRLVPDPTDAELEALFNEGKDRLDAHTEEELVFGYQSPDKVQIEWLTVDPALLVERIRVSAKEARPYFEANQTRFTKPSEGPILDPARPAMVQMTFEEAEKQVKEELRQIKAGDEAARVINMVIEELRKPWDSVPPDAEGKRPPPDPSTIGSLEELAKKFSIDAQVIYHKTELIDLTTLRNDVKFGRATIAEGRQRIQAPNLAFHVVGLPEQPTVQNAGRAQLRLNEPSPISMAPVVGMKGQQPFVFRVVAVAPKAPPATWTEVREKLASDFKTKRAYEMAGEHARKLAEAAATEGLDAAVEQAIELREVLQAAESAAATQPVVEGTPPKKYLENLKPVAATQVTRQFTSAPNIGFSQKIGDAAFATTTQPVEKPHRVLARPMATTRKWAVVEVLKVKPLYQDDFINALQQIRPMTNQISALTRLQEWCKTENVFKRTGFTPVMAQ